MQITAAKVILLTPDLRDKYEKGGLEAIDEDALAKNGIQVRVTATFPASLCVLH